MTLSENKKQISSSQAETKSVIDAARVDVVIARCPVDVPKKLLLWREEKSPGGVPEQLNRSDVLSDAEAGRMSMLLLVLLLRQSLGLSTRAFFPRLSGERDLRERERETVSEAVLDNSQLVQEFSNSILVETYVEYLGNGYQQKLLEYTCFEWVCWSGTCRRCQYLRSAA